MKISRTARARVLQITYVRKASGSLNNFACKPTDESKRLSALSIDGSSSTTQITPATTGKAADKIMFIFLRVKRHRERRLKLATLPGTESRRSTPNRASLRLGAQSDQFSFGVHVGRGAKMVRASRHKDSRSDRACILDLRSMRRRRCDPCPLREDHELRHHVAPIFSLTRPRWTLIVPSVVPSCEAICLLSMPAITHLSTSNSRGVSVASRSRTSLRCERWSHCSDDRSRARLTALRRFSS